MHKQKDLDLSSLTLKDPKTKNNTNFISNLQSLNVANEETEHPDYHPKSKRKSLFCFISYLFRDFLV